MNESAFALGAIAHYAADDDGDRAVNRAVTLISEAGQEIWPGEYGVDDDPAARLKTEFGFDVLEVAKGQYAPDAYRDFIRLVSKPVVERAFLDTYSIPLDSVLAIWTEPSARIVLGGFHDSQGGASMGAQKG